MHRAILPKLVQVFRLEFTINPAAQDLNPLEWALQWVAEGLLSVPIAVHLLETEMFPKWQKVLWAWLTSPSVVFEEVSGWYSSWKALLPPELLPSLQHQFRFGLDMMNQALMGGPGALQVMPPPPVPLAHQPSVDEKNQKTQARKAAMGSDTTPTTLPPKKPQLSFVDYLQRAAADQGIEFLPLVGKSHPVNGRPLYKLSGKSHLTVYIDQGLLFVRSPGSSDWEPMSVDEAVSRASQ